MITRKTKETDIAASFRDDKKLNIQTGSKFFDHMLNALFFHAGIGIDVNVFGDIETGYHHSIEDLGIVLGMLFREKVERSKSYQRFASIYSPMDDALIHLVIDVSNRPLLNYKVDYSLPYIADFPLELIREFLIAFVNNSRVTLHVRKIDGLDSHHTAEAVFKGLGRAMGEVLITKPSGILSTKGVI